MTTTQIREDEKITARGESFRIRVKGGYGTLHYSTLGGNCKMCAVSDIGNCMESSPALTIERMHELFKAVKKLVFVVNLSRATFLERLKQEFELIDLSIIPIGYSAGALEDSGLTYVATFFTSYKEFKSSDVTPEVVKSRARDEKFIKRIETAKKELS